MAKTDDSKTVSNSATTLLSSIERVESLNQEIDEVKERIKDEMSAVKSMGFDTKIVREIIKRRKMDPNALAEKESLIETYEHALIRAADERRAADEGRKF